jgi:hypothetical protein
VRGFACLVLALAFALPVSATGVELEFGESKLYLLGIEGSSNFNKLKVWNGRFRDASGLDWDTSNLYKNKSQHFNIRARVLHPMSERIKLIHGVYLDNGYKADLFMMSPEVVYSPTLVYQHSKAMSITFTLDGVFRFGGKVKEYPCFDDFERAFHCGTGLPWSDSGEFHLSPMERSSLALIFHIVH